MTVLAYQNSHNMVYRAFPRHTYLTDTIMDAPILDTIFRVPASMGLSYPPCNALTWWEGRCILPIGIRWDPGTLTTEVATVAHIAPEPHCVAFAYAAGAIVVRDSWHGGGPMGARFDAGRATYGDTKSRWAGVFASFHRRHCGLLVQPEAVYAPCWRQQETECGVEAMNNTLQTIYTLTGPGTLTRAHIPEAENVYLVLLLAGIEAANPTSFCRSVLLSCARTMQRRRPLCPIHPSPWCWSLPGKRRARLG